MRRRRTAVPAADRDAFIPGLRPRGHEDVLYATSRELLASLPRPAEHQLDPRWLGDDQEPLATASDQQLVRAFLHRHGHRSEP